MHGLPGVGKSDYAKYLAKKLDGFILNTNYIRKEVMAVRVYDNPQDGKMPFTQEQLDLSYKIMLYAARQLIRAYVPAILDATFHSPHLVDEAKEVAAKENRPAYVVEVVCSEQVLENRIRERFAAKESESIAGWEHYCDVKDNLFRRYPTPDYTVDNSGEFGEGQLNKVIEQLQQRMRLSLGQQL